VYLRLDLESLRGVALDVPQATVWPVPSCVSEICYHGGTQTWQPTLRTGAPLDEVIPLKNGY
jgi:hypothetical protein